MLIGDKYEESAQKALDFIKRMLDPSDWEVQPYYGKKYEDYYTGKIMWGGARNIPDTATRIDPQYINASQFYMPGYSGVVSGVWANIPDPENYAVDVYVITDVRYFSCSCPLRSDGTWKSEQCIKVIDTYAPNEAKGETTTKTITYWYWQDTIINSSQREDHVIEFELVRKDWTDIPIDGQDSVYDGGDGSIYTGSDSIALKPISVAGNVIEYGYSRFVDYNIRLCTLADAEYTNDETTLWAEDIIGLPDTAPPIDGYEDEITNIVVGIGKYNGRYNFSWLSTEDSETAYVKIHGIANFTAVNCGKISRKSGYTTYKAEVTGLYSLSDYEYTIYTGDLTSERYSLKSQMVVDNCYTFILAGDPQITTTATGDTWQYSISKALENYPTAQFIASTGDQVDEITEPNLSEQQMDLFLSLPQLKTLPLLPTMGNHDNNSNFKGHFFVPNESTLGVTHGTGDFYFKYDKTLFICLNSNSLNIEEHTAFITSTRNKYINDNGNPKWTIVMMHHSIFAVGYYAAAQNVLDLRALAPVFSANKVDLVLMGHDHCFCRTFIMQDTEIVAESGVDDFTKTSSGQVSYITLNSSSGSKFYAITLSDANYKYKASQEMIPNISAVTVTDNAISVSTHRTSDMTLVDNFILRKE